MEIARYWRLYRVFTKQFIKQIVQSKLDFVLGLLGFLFTQISGVAFLYLIFRQIPTLDSWTFDELLFIYGFSQIPRGIDHLFTDNIWLFAWGYVVDGQFDRYMLRPMNLLFQLICEKLQPDAIGELLVGVILIARSYRKGIITISPKGVVLFFVSVIAGALIYTSIKLFFASIAFWVKISGPILYTAYQTSDFSKYPTEVYSKPVRFIVTWIIPFAFVCYLPAKYFLKSGGSCVNIALEWVIAVVCMIIAYNVFRIGTRRYESAGN